MTTAPAMPDPAKTANAVGIRSSAGFERPALNLNKINAPGLLKIVSLSSLQETAFLAYSNHRRASNPTKKKLNMKTVTYDLVIDSISAVHGEYPGSVDVSYHQEGGDLGRGVRDGFQTDRIALSSAIINPDGSINQYQVNEEVCSKVGATVTVEIDEEA